jgi:hypothetical protein
MSQRLARIMTEAQATRLSGAVHIVVASAAFVFLFTLLMAQ